jgi:uncharacterized protein (TIGR02271 family)
MKREVIVSGEDPDDPGVSVGGPHPVVIPVAEERVRVDKRVVTTGKVRVDKRVRTEPVRLEEALKEEDVIVERVPVDRFVDEAPGPRQEGDTWVLPLVEEVLVVQRRLRVREEVRIRRKVTTHREVVTTTRRIEEADVERRGPDDDVP